MKQSSRQAASIRNAGVSSRRPIRSRTTRKTTGNYTIDVDDYDTAHAIDNLMRARSASASGRHVEQKLVRLLGADVEALRLRDEKDLQAASRKSQAVLVALKKDHAVRWRTRVPSVNIDGKSVRRRRSNK
jgi:hypothetical protein